MRAPAPVPGLMVGLAPGGAIFHSIAPALDLSFGFGFGFGVLVSLSLSFLPSRFLKLVEGLAVLGIR